MPKRTLRALCLDSDDTDGVFLVLFFLTADVTSFTSFHIAEECSKG